MDRTLAALRFRQAATLLPAAFRPALEQLSEAEQARVEEIRLRAGFPLSLSLPDGEREVAGCPDVLRGSDLVQVLEIATQASAHTALDRVRNGFVTVQGGHRIGLCGSAVMQDGAVINLRQLSSLAIRVAREVKGVARPLLDRLMADGVLQNTLILSPPGRGKTTLLRDLIRCLSDGDGTPPRRVGVADERGELAALCAGLPRLDVGRHTDIMDACPKGTGLLMLLRGMNPQVLAADEITAPEDIAALELAANCGVTLLATAHGRDLANLRRRPLYRRLLALHIFSRIILITTPDGVRRYTVCTPEGTPC